MAQRSIVWTALLLSTWLITGCNGADKPGDSTQEGPTSPTSPTPENPPVVTEPTSPDDPDTAAPPLHGPDNYTFCSEESMWWLGSSGKNNATFGFNILVTRP